MQKLKSELKCSASPIFTVYKNMKEIQDDVRIYAMNYFENICSELNCDIPVFKQIGMKMVLFAVNEPNLFRFLFMQENNSATSFDSLFAGLGKTAMICIETIKTDYGLNDDQAKMLFENVWIYTFGIGALCATRVCSFSEEQLGNMLTIEFNAIMQMIKTNKEE